MAQLRSVTCYRPMGSHSVTCHPTQVNTPRLYPSHTGRYSIFLPRRDGRLSWPSWLDSAPAGSRTSDLSITTHESNAQPMQPPRRPIWGAAASLSRARQYFYDSICSTPTTTTVRIEIPTANFDLRSQTARRNCAHGDCDNDRQPEMAIWPKPEILISLELRLTNMMEIPTANLALWPRWARWSVSNQFRQWPTPGNVKSTWIIHSSI